MKAALALAVALFVSCVAGLAEPEYQNAFLAWTRKHNKIYASSEFNTRYSAFKANLDYVRAWNAQGNPTVLDTTIHADLTNEEYRRIVLGTKFDGSARLQAAKGLLGAVRITAPSEVDWVAKGAVTAIKNQGQCGSCWSFSTTGSVEGITFLKKGNLVSLSEQNLIDCSTSYGNQGCNGGLMDQAFQYVIANGGIDTEASYPYEGVQGTCRYNAANSGATISSFKDVTSGNEADLAAALQQQPVSVAIDASHTSFQLYTSGIYHSSFCSSSRLDHGVLAVGYGTDTTSNKNYYIVKNSWGTSWGQAGFIYMSKDRNNNCGIATSASYPIV